MEFYKKTIMETFAGLETGQRGLSNSDAAGRISRYGYNITQVKDGVHPLRILLGQLNSPLIWILIFAAFVSFFVGEPVDAIVIGIVLVINTIIGFAQEYKAEKSIEALKRLDSQKAIVIRDGIEREIDAAYIVPGDIIMVRTGDKVPADARLIEAINLQVQESMLTGESVPVKKNLSVYNKDLEIGDRKNMLYSGTIITDGRAKAVVTETGMKTEKGKIAHMIQETEADPTPLQKQLKYLGKWIAILTLVICAVVFAAGIIRGGPLVNVSAMAMKFFMISVSLAVAAIPEGLPAVVTIALAIGVKKMVKKKVLIRKLHSVETLGCTTVICTDKTGTLTLNEMTVEKVFVDDEVIDVSGSGYEPKGSFSMNTRTLPMLLKIGALNNDAELVEKEGEYEIIGDPTEGALIVSAAKAGLDKEMLETKNKRVDEIQFSAERKMMTTIHEFNNKMYAYSKGAPDVLLERCRYIEVKGSIREMTEHDRIKALKISNHFAGQALRVLGFAYKEIKHDKRRENYEKGLVFVGLQAMMDPVRDEAKDSIEKCKRAGIKVVMITGDFEATASAIARQLGITGRIVTGKEIDRINLKNEVMEIGVYARVNPEHKLKIIEAFKERGQIVAMTGDGINDAPALKKSDIGIAMGIKGTDVAKEASDMILLDDNFTSIVNAVEEGRTIYDNIRKFVDYLLSSNIGEVLVIFLAVMFGLPLPLIAVQILWINLVTDGLPALALGVDPASPNIMDRKPRKPKSRILDLRKGSYIFFIGLVITIGTLGLFEHYDPSANMMYAQTIAFSALMFFQMFNVFNCRSEYKSFFGKGMLSNKWLIGAIMMSVLLQLAVIYTPLSVYFRTVPIALVDWAWIVIVSSSVLWAGELVKLLKRMLVRERAE